MSLKVLVSVVAVCAGAIAIKPVEAGEELWLPIVSTRSTLGEAVAAANSLHEPGTLKIVSTDDCSNLREGLYVVVPVISTDQAAAERAVQAWRAKVKDAYVRACEVEPESRLTFSLPSLDPSIARRPPDTVNWTFDDAESAVVALENGARAIVVPRYEPAPEDPREGLKVGVSLAPSVNEQPYRVLEDCLDPTLSSSERFIAIACITGAEGENLMHATHVFRVPSLTPVLTLDHCRAPELLDDLLQCAVESVDSKGRLQLSPKQVELPPA